MGLKHSSIMVYGWMTSDLNLKGTDLLVYAIIYSYSRAENQYFTGGVGYISKFINVAKSSVYNSLNKLIEKGLIKLSFLNSYYANLDILSFDEFNQIIEEPINNTNTINNTNKFIKPTLEEVKKYCDERKNGIDAEAFIAFYESKGWKVGSSPMKNWKAAIITWEKKNPNNRPIKEEVEENDDRI